jgi:hypothetical protein
MKSKFVLTSSLLTTGLTIRAKQTFKIFIFNIEIHRSSTKIIEKIFIEKKLIKLCFFLYYISNILTDL